MVWSRQRARDSTVPRAAARPTRVSYHGPRARQTSTEAEACAPESHPPGVGSDYPGAGWGYVHVGAPGWCGAVLASARASPAQWRTASHARRGSLALVESVPHSRPLAALIVVKG